MNHRSIYDDVIVIGCESSCANVLAELVSRREQWGYTLHYFEYEPYSTALFERICRENHVAHECFHFNKAELTRRLCMCENRTLILSVRNTYLFPRKVVEKTNIDILNCHSALLPKYPGRNSQTWAIYCGERVSGPTWHWINEDVDARHILWQRECTIGEDTKAYELTKSIAALGQVGFCEIIDRILDGTAQAYPQPYADGERRVYLSKEIPGNGHFSLNDDPQYIYRLLRSVDYGPQRVFPKMRTVSECMGDVEVVRYKKCPTEDDMHLSDEWTRIPYDKGYDLLLKLRKVEQNRDQ